MHTRTERALQIVEVDDGHLCLGIAADGPTEDIDSGAGSFGQVKLLQPRQRIIVLRNQKNRGLLLGTVAEGNWQRIESDNVALTAIAQGHVVVRWNVILGTDCQLNLAIEFRLKGVAGGCGLRFAAHSGNQDKNE